MSKRTQPQNVSRVWAYNSTPPQNIPNNLATQAILDAVVFDTLNEFDVATYTFTPIREGYYLITCGVWGTAAANGVQFTAYVSALPGVGVVSRFSIPVTALHAYAQTATGITHLTPNNTISLWVYQSTGVNMPIGTAGNPDEVYLMIQRVS